MLLGLNPVAEKKMYACISELTYCSDKLINYGKEGGNSEIILIKLQAL
jgi:hypothetical protein